MKKSVFSSLKLLVSAILIAVFGFVCVEYTDASTNNSGKVPDYYYANYKFINEWNDIRDIFTTIKSRSDLGLPIDMSLFSRLESDFRKCFPNLPSEFKTVYEKCTLLASDIASHGIDENGDNLNWLLGNSCYRNLSQAVSKINSSYTVRTTAKSNPSQGSAPITVTFDARESVDPSSETIPTDNFYWYYRDENGVDNPIGKGAVINYEFKESGKFVVHLVVRSSNVNDGILDGEQDLIVNVTPKAANIIVYANTRKMSTETPIKIGIAEGEKGVVFDGSTTMPTGGRKIQSHRWSITNSTNGFSYSKGGDGAPGYINVPLSGNGEYKITLTTKDNENNTVSETFTLYMSDPVAIIKQTPGIGTTSTLFAFDGSASYSLMSRLNTYIWEVFDENGDKVNTDQGKKLSVQFLKPGNYKVRLTVTDARAQTNVEIKDIYVESTTPTPQFTMTATNKWTSPSEFTLDASNSMDIDVTNKVDSLEYRWSFSSNSTEIVSSENNNQKIVVQFNETGRHTVTLTVTDQYGKFASTTKTIDVKSILRPEIEAKPGAITRGKLLSFESTINSPVINYVWDYGDGKTTDSQKATNTTHVYGERGIYTVTLTVYDKDGNSNTVTEKVFIGEVDYPIAAYKVKDSQGFYIQASDRCRVVGDTGTTVYDAYPIDRYASFTINPSISVNTQGNSNWLEYVFEPESLIGNDQAMVVSQLTHKFSQTGCHYVDLTIQDGNVGKQDKVRIRFNVKNASPTIRNVLLSFPQYTDDSVVGFGNPISLSTASQTTYSETNSTIIDCSGSNNIMLKVTAVDASDSDGSVSRLRFYYYNVDDPARILEYKETRINAPYVYFSIPRTAGEYRFGVMVYDNDGGMVNSDDALGSNPSVYIPSIGCSTDIPTVTLKVSSQNIEVGSTVTYTVVSRIASMSSDDDADRTFYYDFTGDGVRDLVTKKDSAIYTFTEPYEQGVKPRAAVEYRGKLGIGDGATIVVRNGIKPILLYNSYKNIVIFRDMSIGALQQRQICFDTKECAAGNNKYKKTHIVTTGIESITGGSITTITQNDSFLWKYPGYGSYDISIYMKSKQGISVSTGFTLTTSANQNNGRITSGVNIITIPETTFENGNPEIFLSKTMNNTLLLYLNHENGEGCYIDKDISVDSDGDGKSDNDVDIACNTISKIVYNPSYDSIIGRIYFTHEGKLVYKNFYVMFEGYVLELSEENKEIYDDITILINGIEDITEYNTDLKRSLDVLRKNLNNKNMVSSTVVTIKNQLEDGGIHLDINQKESLDYILSRLSSSDTIVAAGMSEYEKSKQEILTILPKELKETISSKFSQFEDAEFSDPSEQADSLKDIWQTIISATGPQALDISDIENLIRPQFCNIFAYYEISSYTKNCTVSGDVDLSIQNNFNEGISSTQVKTDKSEGGGYGWLKIVLIVFVCGLLIMGGIIVFFAIKARLGNNSEEDEG